MARVLPIAPTAVPTLDELAADPQRASTLSATVRAQLLTRCAAVLAALSGAMAGDSAHPCAQAALHPEPDRLLTVPEAATVMGFAPSYVYEMARRGDLPVVRRKKYVRVRRSALDQWMAEHESRGVDNEVSNMLRRNCEGQRDQARAQGVGTQSGRTRRETRRASDDRQPVGA